MSEENYAILSSFLKSWKHSPRRRAAARGFDIYDGIDGHIILRAYSVTTRGVKREYRDDTYDLAPFDVFFARVKSAVENTL